MNIHQLSVAYVQAQDRLLVRINTRPAGEEVQLWFTRRLALPLWPQLRRAAAQAAEFAAPRPSATPADNATRRLVGEFQREAALQKADFTTPYQAPAARAPAPAADPLLVTEVRLSAQPGGALRLLLQETLPDRTPRGLQVELTGTMVHGFVHLLGQALQTSQWRETPAAERDDDKAGPGTPAAAPRYLN